jgi:hypothetical protein
MAITLTASSDFETAGKQYIARITGRAAKVQFVREFIGRRSGKRNDCTEALVDEPGLYEIQNPTRKDHKARYWLLIVEFRGELVKFRSDEEDALKIAKRLDGRETIDQIVAAEVATNEEGGEKMVYAIRTPGEAKRAEAAATEESAVESILSVLAALPASLQRKALASARLRLFPAAPKPERTPEAEAPSSD